MGQSTWGKQTANMQLTASQFDTVYNVTSFGLACMMASTAFFFLRLGSMTERYQEALCYTGLVTFIAFYHYYRIFNSFDAAFTPCEVVDGVVNAQVRPGDLRLLAHRPLLQRCLPLHGLAPDRAPAADRDRARDEAVP